jgi:CATRA-Associated Small Protein
MTADAPDLDADELRASTLRAVHYLLKLKLPQARWERVAQILETAIGAAAAGELARVRQATDDLMFVSPTRIVKADGLPAEPADQKIFERANVLIYALQSMQPAPDEDKDSGGR